MVYNVFQSLKNIK